MKIAEYKKSPAGLSGKLKNIPHFDEHNNKLKKKAATLALTTVLGASMLLTGCGGTSANPNPGTDAYGNPQTTDKTEIGGTASTTEEEQTETGLIPLILANDEYNDAINKYLTEKDSSFIRIYSHPLSFLQGQGFDIEAIKSGEIQCETLTYVRSEEPNSLYVKTAVFVEDEYATHPHCTQYYHQYLLKYELTKEEMDDYQYLHNKYYVQASTTVSLISELKDEIILSEAKLTKIAYDGILDGINQLAKTTLNLDRYGSFIITDYSVEDKTVNIIIFSNHELGLMTGTKSQIVDCTINSYFAVKFINDILIEPNQRGYFELTNISTEKVTFFLMGNAMSANILALNN